MGIYKSTDGGDSWTLLPAPTTTTVSGPYTGNAFLNRSITQIAVDPTDPDTIYVGSGSGFRGISSVLSGGVGGPPGGTAFPLPTRGVSSRPTAARRSRTSTSRTRASRCRSAGRRTSRSIRSTTTRSTPGSSARASAARPTPARLGRRSSLRSTRRTRPSSSVIRSPSTQLADGKTRMYLGDGDNGTFSARLYRTDDATAATPAFTNITTSQDAGYCGSAVLVRQRRLLAGRPA